MWGLPAPQGSKKFFGVSKTTGKARIGDTSPNLVPWRNAVSDAASRELDRLDRPAPFSVAVSLLVWFTFDRPVSVKRSKRPHMSIAPDLSKLVRSTEDALKDAGVIKDDSLIILLSAGKSYVGEAAYALDRPGAFIRLHPVVAWDMPPGRGRLELEQ